VETNEPKATRDDFPRQANSDITTHRAESTVLEAFRQVLALDVVDPDLPFAALGGDSMRAVRVLSRLWRELGVELPVHTLGNATNAAELAVTVQKYATDATNSAAATDAAGAAS
jgi:acyl carrier protein